MKKSENPVSYKIKGQKISLVSYTRKFYKNFLKGLINDPLMSVNEYIYTEERANNLCDKIESRGDLLHCFLICENKTKEIIGDVSLKRIDYEKKECTLSIVLQTDNVKNKGYGTEAILLAIDYAFNKLMLISVLADTVIRNTRSQHVLKKLGFKEINKDNEFIYFNFLKIV